VQKHRIKSGCGHLKLELLSTTLQVSTSTNRCIATAVRRWKRKQASRSPVNNHRWPNAEYVPERLALADLHWAMRRTNRPVLTLALVTDTRVLPSRPPPVIRTHVRLELATFLLLGVAYLLHELYT